jgi:hypothetical protein
MIGGLPHFSETPRPIGDKRTQFTRDLETLFSRAGGGMPEGRSRLSGCRRVRRFAFDETPAGFSAPVPARLK